MSVTDRQTDRQMDERTDERTDILLANAALKYIVRPKTEELYKVFLTVI